MRKTLFALVILFVAVATSTEASSRRRSAGPGSGSIAKAIECPAGFILRSNLIQENDGDLYAVGEISSVCAGELLIGPAPRRYYRDPRGVQYLDATSGFFYLGDCDDSSNSRSSEVWRNVEVAQDANKDGIADGPISTACVGEQALINERWYLWRPFDGFAWLGMNAEQVDPMNYAIAYGSLRGGTDVDLDGYAAEMEPGLVFGVGHTVINGRTYRRSTKGDFSVLVHAEIIGYGDRDDSDSLIH